MGAKRQNTVFSTPVAELAAQMQVPLSEADVAGYRGCVTVAAQLAGREIGISILPISYAGSLTDAVSIPMVVRKDTVLRLLTGDLLFDLRSGISSYPHSPAEYQAILGRILYAKGRFPGDREVLTPGGTYAHPPFEGLGLH
jgi:hypothetical protein